MYNSMRKLAYHSGKKTSERDKRKYWQYSGIYRILCALCKANEGSVNQRFKSKVFSQNKDCIFLSVGLDSLNPVLSVDCAESVVWLHERPACLFLSVACLFQVSAVYPG